MWAPQSPQVTLKAPPGMNKGHIIHDFDRRIIRHQPLTYLKVVAGDILYSFSPVRGDGPEHYPTGTTTSTRTSRAAKGELATLRAYSPAAVRACQPALAGFLTGYGRDFYVPGPLLAAGLALGLAGMAGIGRARRSRLRGSRLLFALGAIAMDRAPAHHRHLRLAVRTAAILPYPDRRGPRRDSTGRPSQRPDSGRVAHGRGGPCPHRPASRRQSESVGNVNL